MDEKYIHEQHSVHHILYHIVFCPKRRRKVLVGEVHDRLKQIIEAVADEHQWQIVELAIQPDHVHLFIYAAHRYCKTHQGVQKLMNCARSLHI